MTNSITEISEEKLLFLVGYSAGIITECIKALERGETKYALFRLEEAREKLFGEIKELIERVKNEKRESCLI